MNKCYKQMRRGWEGEISNTVTHLVGLEVGIRNRCDSHLIDIY